MKRRAICVLLPLLLACAAHAGKMFPLSIEQLAQKAELVVSGNVLSKSVQRDAGGRIYTRIEFQVADAWKGRPKANPFVLVHSGGVLGEEIATTEDQVDFCIGEEAVLFLRLNERGEGVVIGMAQGKFKVGKDNAGQKIVQNIFHGSPEGPPGATGRLTLAEFKRRVQRGQP